MNNKLIDTIFFVGFIVSVFLVGCSPNHKTTRRESAQDSTMANVLYEEPAAYQYITSKDTVSLIIKPALRDSIEGTLVYKLFEKDANEGSVKGKFSGDTLFCDYTFQSEGRTSVREIAFLRKDEKLLEGYGPVKEVDNRSVFISHQALKFGKGIILTNTRP